MKTQLIFKSLISTVLMLCLMPINANADYGQREDVQQFIKQMNKDHGFDSKLLKMWMSGVKQQKTALEAIARPAEGVLSWGDYRKIFVTDSRINKGVKFWQDNAELLARAEKQYGVSAEFIVAIIGVETYYGKRAGNYSVLDALTTLGFDYPLENTTKERRDRREKFFRKELVQFLLMSREEKFDPRELKGSYAGAMGMPQFIPSSFRHYAVDFDGNGVRDFWTGSADSIGSVANYFKKHGWKTGEPVAGKVAVKGKAKELGGREMKPKKLVADYKKAGVSLADKFSDTARATLLKLDSKKGDEYWLGMHNFYVITRYNHSPMYAMAVYQLGQTISKKYHSN